MSRRKIVTEGKVWATDRRTTRRYFLFRPDEGRELHQAFWYCLAHCANKYEVEVHAATLMSTHPHMVYTDMATVQPDFKRDFHRLFALCTKARLGWPEEVFNKGKGGESEPLTPKALIDAIAYAIANPVAAYAVRYAKDWPGPTTAPRDIGTRVIRVKRPEYYFDAKSGQWPDELELRLTMPALLEAEYGLEGAQERIATRVKELEREAWREAEKKGIAFRGARRVMRIPHTARARSHEVFGGRVPRFSAAGNREAAQAKVREYQDFDEQYDHALTQWVAGNRRAVFPYGTWWMRVHHKAACRPPP